MAYNLTKEQMIEYLKKDAEYFPFEQIISYKKLQAMNDWVPISAEVKVAYMSFFRDVKECCIKLLKHNGLNTSNDNRLLWKEAIEEIDRLL